MVTTALVNAPFDNANATSRPPVVDPAPALADRIAALAAHLHAVTYELLALLREFDDRGEWQSGCASCAHWLHWRTGIALGAAREKVRVAHVLARLPRVSATMARGAISYAKVRAITRVATPETETALLDFAQAGTAAHVERFVRAWRRVDRSAAASQAESRHLHRELSTWVDDDGMVVIRGRLSPEVGAVVQRALEAVADRLFKLAGELDRGSAGDRYQVMVHMELPTGVAAGEGLCGTVEVDHGAVDVSAETSRRLSCDASVVTMQHGTDGGVLDVGRNTRTVPPSIRRALEARDRSCRFPGCTARRCDAHHVEHWMDGGDTSVQNLVLLCRRHHRAVHEGGFDVMRQADGTVTFLRSNGTVLEAAPALPAGSRAIAVLPGANAMPVWDGTPFDVVYAIDVLYAPRDRSAPTFSAASAFDV